MSTEDTKTITVLHEPRGVSTPDVSTTSTETPAETPPAAFVLPDLYALTMAIANDSPLHLPVERREQFKAAAERVQALLAEHAVTEERLAEALVATNRSREEAGSWNGDARLILGHLTRKAAS